MSSTKTVEREQIQTDVTRISCGLRAPRCDLDVMAQALLLNAAECA